MTQTRIIWVLVITIIVLVAALSFLLGRGWDEGSVPKATNKISPAKTAVRAEVVTAKEPAKKATDAALRASVVGSWASLESECRTDDYELFAADGRYSAASMAEGSWSVSNGQISTLIDREPEDMGGDWKSLSKPRELRRKFTIDGHDRISIWYAGERFRMMRCDDGSYHTWNG